MGHSGRADREDAEAALARGVDEAHRRCRHGFERESVRRRARRSAKPIAMTWDHLRPALDRRDGRLSERDADARGQGRDRISICEDTDGDGRADKFTVFAEKLSIPTSLLLRQRRCDRSRRPPTRCSSRTPTATTRPTCARCCSPAGTRTTPTPGRATCAGGWITGSGASSATRGSSGEVGGEHHSFRQGFFRFKPDGSKLEFLRSTNNNSWGVGFSEEGLVFGSTANGMPERLSCRSPTATTSRSAAGRRQVLRNIADSNRLLPDHREGPAGRLARRVHRRRRPRALHGAHLPEAVLEPHGLRRRADRAPGRDVHARTATATRFPLAHTAGTCWPATTSGPLRSLAEVGPDGNVWVIDWYNYIVQHNPTPEGFKTGKGIGVRDPAARQDPRPHLSHRLERRQAQRLAKAVEGRPEGTRRSPEE